MMYRKYIHTFGWYIFIYKAMRRLCLKSESGWAWKINDKNEKNIEAYLEKQLKQEYPVLDQCLSYRNPTVPRQPIFVMWWQGIEEAPPIVKCCINSMKENSGTHEVILISEKNIDHYFKIPEFIMERVRMGEISRTHLSDIIRLGLLALYGGLWLDATVFVASPIREELFQRAFYSINFGKRTKDPSHGRWTTFLIFAQKDNKLVTRALQYLLWYWINQDMLVDYILFDYIINYVIKQDKECAEMIRQIAPNNVDVFQLLKVINEPCGSWDYKNRDTCFYKLSWKRDYRCLCDGKKTIYKDILDKFCR